MNTTFRTGAARSQAGFSLLEALVSLLIVAFGMLAIAGFQISLSRNSDVAKQRAEALRLAQETVEKVRSFYTVGTVGTAYAGWGDLPAGGVETTDAIPGGYVSNTTYTRSYLMQDTSITAATGVAGYSALERGFRVRVGWTDRAGESQEVVLLSVVSKSDPTDVGSLNVPTIENGILRRPKGRDINIPVPATQLGGTNAGKSKLSFGSDTLIFSDVSGDVVYLCANTAASSIGDNTNLATTCTATVAYLLIGFISADPTNSLPAPSGLLMRFRNGTNPDGSGLTKDITGTPKCIVNNAVDQNNSNTTISGYLSYVCLVEPPNHATPTAPIPSGRHWTGKVELTASTILGSSTKVCRYGYDPASSATTVDNAKHPPTYRWVTETLDNQNYLLKSSGNCPSGTIEHQNALPGCPAFNVLGGTCSLL